MMYKMTQIIYSVLLGTLLISSVAPSIIDLNSTATPIITQSNISSLALNTYTDNIISLNSTTSTISEQINQCMYLLQSGNFIAPNSSLASAIQRIYTNGTTEYQLFIENVDQKLNIQEYDATVRLAASDVYFLTQFSSYSLTIGNSSNSQSTPAPNFIVAPQASSLTEVVNKLTVGYSSLNSTQISSDQQLSVLDGYLKNLFSISGATLSYAAQQSVNSQVRYRLFYTIGTGSSFHFKAGQAIFNSDNKILFIHGLLQVQIPAQLVPK